MKEYNFDEDKRYTKYLNDELEIETDVTRISSTEDEEDVDLESGSNSNGDVELKVSSSKDVKSKI